MKVLRLCPYALPFWLCAALLFSIHSVSSATFSTSLHSEWRTDLWIEALELIAHLNKEAFQSALLKTKDVESPNALFRLPSIPEVYSNFFNLALKSRQMSAKVQASFSDFERMVKDEKTRACPFIYIPRFEEDKEEVLGSPTCDFQSALDQFKQVKLDEVLTLEKTEMNVKVFGKPSDQKKLIIFSHPRHQEFKTMWDSLTHPSLSLQFQLKFKPYSGPNEVLNRDFLADQTVLPGYFCHLYIKNTEYKVTDDRNMNVPRSEQLESSTQHTNFLPLEAAEKSTIGLKLISNLSSIKEFEELASNFPSALPTFKNVKVRSALANATEANSQSALRALGLIASEGIIWINGKPKNADSIHWLQLLAYIRDELDLMNTIQSLGLDVNVALDFLRLKPDSSGAHLYNMSLLDHIMWLNDLEKDKRYRHWPNSLQSFLMPSMSLPRVARNVFNVVFFMDLTHPGHIETAFELISNIRSNMPIRFGLVPMVDQNPDSNRSKLGSAFYKVYLESGLVQAVDWLGTKPLSASSMEIESTLHHALFRQCQLFSVPLAGEFFLNGESFPFTFNYKRALSEKIRDQIGRLMKWIYYDEIRDTVDASSIFYSMAHTWDSRHPFVFTDIKKHHFSEWNGTPMDNTTHLYVQLRGAVNDEVLEHFKVAQKTIMFAFEHTPEPTFSSSSELIVNGKSFGPLPKKFNPDILILLLQVEAKTRLLPLLQKCKACQNDMPLFWKLTSFWWYNRVRGMSTTSSFLRQLDESETRTDPSSLFECKTKGACLKLPSKKAQKLDVYILLDPVTELAQKLIPLFTTLANSLDFLSLTIVWNVHTEKPLPNRFTRFVDPMATNQCSFSQLPPILYTLALDTPHAWATFPIQSALDLDNLINKQDEHAYFVLRHLLVEGHAEDATTGAPPRGVQFILSHPEVGVHHAGVQDTVVMANLGYFQLKATPGTHLLRLRPGRSADLYRPVSKLIEMDQLTGITLFPKLEKQLGKEMQSVLDTPELSWWNTLVGYVRPKSDARTIHVFSVASGHLYERFLSIMMQSVKNHTTSPLKFWLIEDFLSPTFKQFLPVLAKEVGFDFELVTFAWPDWLNKQTVKQRTIWGYKILFLDVLFPLSLNRIIFVDADQIVRTDLAELRDMDLQGAVYGYTPFCNSRDDMDNFRFWEKGFWKSHLAGKPYHISALYVVDLARFRQLAAGDILRQQYQSLSNDPNSLANLDQDLPNSMQQLLPIHSLPQDWLWCETWCDDASLSTAKTIDLCNNPKTKEPKLDRARRLLPEWSVYDERASKLWSKLSVSDTSAFALPHLSNTSQPLLSKPSAVSPNSREDL